MTLAPMQDRVPATVGEWKSFLQEFSKEALEADDRRQEGRSLSDEVHDRGYIGSPPASQDAIVEAESRLGVRFPQSYRNFLLASNGWPYLGASNPDRILGVEEVARVVDRDSSLVEDGYPYESTVRSAIVISGLNSGSGDNGDGVLTLTPTALGPDGEWQCFDYAPWHPGVDRFGSFGRRMVELRKDARDELDPNSLPASDPHPDQSAGPEPPQSDDSSRPRVIVN